MFTTLLQATAAASEAPLQSSDTWKSFLPLIIIIVVFYFFMIRPQQKRQKELNKFRDALKKGDKVVTTGGVYATVVKVSDNKIDLEVASGVIVTFDRSAVLQSVADNVQKQ